MLCTLCHSSEAECKSISDDLPLCYQCSEKEIEVFLSRVDDMEFLVKLRRRLEDHLRKDKGDLIKVLSWAIAREKISTSIKIKRR